jgi:hypothetical protein
MPKNTDPSLIVVSTTTRDNTTSILNSQIKRDRDAYSATQISDYNDPYDKYFSEDVSGKLNELSGALPDKLPALGEGTETFDNGSTTGVVDWGILKQADSDIWSRYSFWDMPIIGIVQSSSNKVDGSVSFPYKRQFIPNSSNGEDPSTSEFNVEDTDLNGAGAGASHLCGFLDANQEIKAGRVISDPDVFGFTSFSGFTIAGTLCPADRGVIALIRTKDQDDLTTPANNADHIASRVIAAINLGRGLESGLDGFPAQEGIFTEGADNFPSRETGQYDLFEVATATYNIDDPNRSQQAIPNLTTNLELGSVRLLRDPLVAGEHPSQDHIPVLFSHRNYNYETSLWEESDASKRSNFLSYRLPLKTSYSPESMLGVPNNERARFFNPKSYSTHANGYLYDTAGGFFGFDHDAPDVQIAKFRYTLKWEHIEQGLLDLIDDARTGTTAYVNIGSFTLVHFKNESAFEALVKDGIAPSKSDLYSVSSVDTNWQDLSSITNMVSTDEYDGRGRLLEITEDSRVNLSVRPNVLITGMTGNDKYGRIDQFCLERWRHYSGIDGNNAPVFEEKIGSTLRYNSISGVRYILPRTQRVYDDNKNTFNGTSFNPSPLYGATDHGGSRTSAGFAFNTIHEEELTNKIGGLPTNFQSPFYVSFDADRNPESIDAFYVKTPPIFKCHFEHLSASNNIGLASISSVDGQLINETMNEGQLQDSLLNIDYDALSASNSLDFTDATVISNGAEPGRWSMVIGSVVGKGDGGQYTNRDSIPMFTDDMNIGFSAYAPMLHSASVPISEFIFSNQYGHFGGGNPEDILFGKKMAYHSARVESLIQNAQVETMDFQLQMISAGGVADDDYAFTVVRLSPDGYLMVQELELVSNALVRCDGTAPVRGDFVGFIPQYPNEVPAYKPNYGLSGYGTGDYTGNAVDFRMKVVLNSMIKDYTGGDGSEMYDSYFFIFYSQTKASFGADKILLKALPNQVNFTSITTNQFSNNPNGGGLIPDSDGIDVSQFRVATYINSSGWNINNPNTWNFSDLIFGTGVVAGAPQTGIEVYPDSELDISEYGNFYDNDNGTIQVGPSFNANGDLLSKPYLAGFTPRKNVQERFLDEMYRITSDFPGFTDQLTKSDGATLITAEEVLRDGNFDSKDHFDDIDFPVTDDGPSVFLSYNPPVYPTLVDFPHKASGWVRGLRNYSDLVDGGNFDNAEIQIKGLPYMTRLQSQSSKTSLSRGVGVIPYQDYASTHRPSIAEGDLFTYPDYGQGYSPYAPASNTDAYCYTRAFDLSFAGSETVTDQITIRLVGLQFSDLDPNYSIDTTPVNQFPHCSGVNDPAIAVIVQIPGTTRWLNIARTNDPQNKNGFQFNNIFTGCYISHQDNVLKEEAIVCTDVRISADPFTFQTNSNNKVPLLVRVVMTLNNAYSSGIYPYNFEANTFTPQDKYHYSTLERRGLIGMEILKESNGLNYDDEEVIPFDEY